MSEKILTIQTHGESHLRAQRRQLSNNRRSNRISNNAVKNRETFRVISEANRLGRWRGEQRLHMERFQESLNKCAQHSLYREHADGSAQFIGAHTCKHKLCHICNAEKSHTLRRKYWRYFHKNEMVDPKSGEIFETKDFDFFHLTLTVPHTEAEGYRGEQFFATELMQMFNQMRRQKFWQDSVFAGEFGVEVTRKNNGMHVHIHSLIVAYKQDKSRNKLAANILRYWNKITVWDGAKRENWQQIEDKNKPGDFITELDIIRDTYSELSEVDLENLDPKGSTLVGLESLYVYSKKKLSNFDKWDADRCQWKHYVKANDVSELTSGVMECIKYHFEPAAMNKDTGEYDLDLIAEVLTSTFRKPLYRKFGAWHTVKSLNMSTENELMDELAENADQVVNPNTLQPVDADSYRYIITNAAGVKHDYREEYKIWFQSKWKRHVLEGVNAHEAMLTLVAMSTGQKKVNQRNAEKAQDALKDRAWNYHEGLLKPQNLN